MEVVSFKNVGGPTVPQEIRRLRRQVMDAMRRLGQPVVLRHMWNVEDEAAGTAKKCPGCYDALYDQVRTDCPVCFGFGFVSIEDEPTGDFFVSDGQRVFGDPGDHLRAPRWGGFGKPYLTWLAEPDVAVDIFRISPEGTLVRTYDAQGVAPWYPELHDNDLCTNVTLDRDGYSILSTDERFQLKQVQQITIRGWGRRSVGHAHLVGQSFAMAHVPKTPNSNIYRVPIPDADRAVPASA